MKTIIISKNNCASSRAAAALLAINEKGTIVELTSGIDETLLKNKEVDDLTLVAEWQYGDAMPTLKQLEAFDEIVLINVRLTEADMKELSLTDHVWYNNIESDLLGLDTSSINGNMDACDISIIRAVLNDNETFEFPTEFTEEIIEVLEAYEMRNVPADPSQTETAERKHTPEAVQNFMDLFNVVAHNTVTAIEFLGNSNEGTLPRTTLSGLGVSLSLLGNTAQQSISLNNIVIAGTPALPWVDINRGYFIHVPGSNMIHVLIDKKTCADMHIDLGTAKRHATTIGTGQDVLSLHKVLILIKATRTNTILSKELFDVTEICSASFEPIFKGDEIVVSKITGQKLMKKVARHSVSLDGPVEPNLFLFGSVNSRNFEPARAELKPKNYGVEGFTSFRLEGENWKFNINTISEDVDLDSIKEANRGYMDREGLEFFLPYSALNFGKNQ